MIEPTTLAPSEGTTFYSYTILWNRKAVIQKQIKTTKTEKNILSPAMSA